MTEPAEKLGHLADKAAGRPSQARVRRAIPGEFSPKAAHILENAAGEEASTMRRRFDGLTAALRRRRALAGALEPAIAHFTKVTRSYRPGLFHCYAVPGLPRTDNDLEQAFGAQRCHERRATGRKSASPAAVLRGKVRLIAATTTRLREQSAADLARAPTGPRGETCALAWTSAGRPAPCAPASDAIPRPASRPWNTRLRS